MIQFTNSADITLTPGQTAVFDTVLINNESCATCTRPGTGSIKMCQCGIYEVRFSGNIGTSGADGTAQLSVALSGAPYAPSVMLSETATAGNLNAVEKTFWVDNCCGDYSRLTVINTGTTSVTIGAGAIFSARKICN